MRLQQIRNSYLTESLDQEHVRLVKLWESTGLTIKEADLTAAQIKQLFTDIEQTATSQGVNRSALGKGKDAVTSVNRAWEDLKSKIQDSKPVQGFDQKVSDALSKIGMGAADPKFNGEVNKWVQKYRDFAKKHPIAQGAIYATLIALAGITGAGVGGAAALGLLKMADKLLQGERFSSAAYSGVKTGITAFAASKLGDLIKGVKPGEQIPPVNSGELPPGTPKMDFDKYEYYMHPNNGVVVQVPKGMGSPFDPSTPAGAARDQLRAAMAQGAQSQGVDAAGDAAFDAMGQAAKLRSSLRGESKTVKGRRLSEGQVYLVIKKITESSLTEGPMDWAKGQAQRIGKNLTTKYTVDKLRRAWQGAGSPADSDDIYNILTGAGEVPNDIVDTVYKSMKIPLGGEPAAADFDTVKQMIMKLPTDRRVRLLKSLTKQSAAPAAA